MKKLFLMLVFCLITIQVKSQIFTAKSTKQYYMDTGKVNATTNKPYTLKIYNDKIIVELKGKLVYEYARTSNWETIQGESCGKGTIKKAEFKGVKFGNPYEIQYDAENNWVQILFLKDKTFTIYE